MRNEAPWTRARLAALAGINLETIRFYEQKQLLPAPERTPAGYRQYQAEHLQRLRFIQRAQALGFTLNEIRELLLLRARKNRSSRRVKHLAEEKIVDIRKRIRDLRGMLVALQHISRMCDGNGSTDRCPILRALGSDALIVSTRRGEPKGQCHDCA